ncbi:hypothetical protein [Pseudomonas sp. FEN]|uniref:hypothetical protein n=1 Tax=Pseudomonas sp. FEN TaxID=2767468 RepID=UPI00174C76ED|nr:hypothetical protein [Pseudomonas sp. FEN]
MSNLQKLRIIESQEIASLRERMSRAGCVFEFVVLVVEPEISVNEALHRQALMAMYEQIMVSQHEWRQSLIRLRPDCIDRIPPLTWKLDQAVATPLDRAKVFDLSITLSPRLSHSTLFDAFCDPPYSINITGESVVVLFKEWLEQLGLDEQDDIVVLNWVDRFQADSDRVEGLPNTIPWSNYFDDGLEWWGVWCLTVWNPRRRTLSALVASATD